MAIRKGKIKGAGRYFVEIPRPMNSPANMYNVSATKNSPGIAAGIFTASLIFEELTGKTI